MDADEKVGGYCENFDLRLLKMYQTTQCNEKNTISLAHRGDRMT